MSRLNLCVAIFLLVCESSFGLAQSPSRSGPPESEIKAFLESPAQKQLLGPRVWKSKDDREWLICVGSAVVPSKYPVSNGRKAAELDAEQMLQKFASGTKVIATGKEVVRSKEKTSADGTKTVVEESVESTWVKASLDSTSKALRCHSWAVDDVCYAAIAYPLVRPGVSDSRRKPSDSSETRTSGSYQGFLSSSEGSSTITQDPKAKPAASSDDAAVKVVRVKGVGTSKGDKAKAISDARDDACKSALKMVCKMTVRAIDSNKTENFETEFSSKIYAEVSGTIKSSVVVGEAEWTDPDASVTMDVTIDTSGIAGKLDQVLQLVGNPTVMVLVEEAVDGSAAADPFIVTELNKALIQEGMMVVDAETTKKIRENAAVMSKLNSLETKNAQEQAASDEARRVMLEYKADVLVLGRMALKQAPAAGGMTTVSGTLQYRMVDAFSGEILVPDSATIQATDKQLDMARRFATTKLLGEDGEKTEFLKSLLKQLRTSMQKRTQGRYLNFKILDCADAKEARLVAATLEKLPLARSTAQGVLFNTASAETEFRMRWLGDPQALTDMLQESLDGDPKLAPVAGLEIVEQSGTRITFRLRKCVDIIVKGTPNGRQKSAINKLLKAAAPPSTKWGQGSVPRRAIGVSDVGSFRDKLFELLDSRGAEWPTLSDETDFDIDEKTNALIITIK